VAVSSEIMQEAWRHFNHIRAGWRECWSAWLEKNEKHARLLCYLKAWKGDG